MSFWGMITGDREAEHDAHRSRADVEEDRQRKRERRRQRHRDEARRARRARLNRGMSEVAPDRLRKQFREDADGVERKYMYDTDDSDMERGMDGGYGRSSGDDEYDGDDERRRRRRGGDRDGDRDGGDYSDEERERKRKERERRRRMEQDEEEKENDAQRARREEEQRRQKRLEEESALQDVVFYSTDVKYSREKWGGIWSALKVLAIVVVMVGGLIIITNNYDLLPCRTGQIGGDEQFCLASQCQNTDEPCSCFGFEEAECVAACGTTQGIGCTATTLSGDRAPFNFTCQDEDDFRAACFSSLSCSDASQSDSKQAVLLNFLVLMFALGFEVVQLVGLNTYAGFEHEEFHKATDRAGTFLIWGTVNAPRAMQFLWTGFLFAYAYLVFIFNSVTVNCDGAQTNTGENADLYPHIRLFLFFAAMLFLALLVLGSFFRHRVLYRGELYRPSNDEQVRIPANLDCHIQRYRESAKCGSGLPRCCPTLCEESCLPLACGKPVKRCCHCSAFCCDRFLCGPVLCCGSTLGWLYEHRHFIGP